MDRIERNRARGLRPEHSWHVFGAPSDYIFISHNSATRLLPIVEQAERVGRTFGNDALMLVDTSEQIQAVFQERWLASMELPKDIDLYAFVLTPGIAHRLGPTPNKRFVAEGLYEIDFLFSVVDLDHLSSVEDIFQRLKDRLLGHSQSAAIAQSNRNEPPYVQGSVNLRSPIRTDQDDVGELIGLRKRLRESVPMVDSEQWGKWRGVTTNPSATLAKYREQGRLFSVREGRNYLYPRFQFTQDAAPLDAIADILEVVPEDARGWPLLSWFEAPSTLLDGCKPSEVLAKDPAAVRTAAADFYSDD
jgi:hypothetical protein